MNANSGKLYCLYSIAKDRNYFQPLTINTRLTGVFTVFNMEETNLFYKLTIMIITELSGSTCIKGSLGVRDSQKLPWDFQKSMPESLGLPTFKDI